MRERQLYLSGCHKPNTLGFFFDSARFESLRPIIQNDGGYLCRTIAVLTSCKCVCSCKSCLLKDFTKGVFSHSHRLVVVSPHCLWVRLFKVVTGALMHQSVSSHSLLADFVHFKNISLGSLRASALPLENPETLEHQMMSFKGPRPTWPPLCRLFRRHPSGVAITPWTIIPYVPILKPSMNSEWTLDADFVVNIETVKVRLAFLNPNGGSWGCKRGCACPQPLPVLPSALWMAPPSPALSALPQLEWTRESPTTQASRAAAASLPWGWPRLPYSLPSLAPPPVPCPHVVPPPPLQPPRLLLLAPRPLAGYLLY